MDVHPNPKAVCAIDFGTARSGYACAFVDTPNRIFNNEFGKELREKLHTCVLLYKADEKYHLSCFGNHAYKKLPELDRDNLDVFAFKYFKMELYEKFDMASMLRAHNGQEVPLVEVITHSLSAIIEEAMQCLTRASTQTISMEDVQWVLTVPALWDDRAKQVMRIAAQNARLSKHLILALEPEAAALYCREDKPELKFRAGCKYMVVDCGGGTVDIAAHEIDNDGFTQSLSAPVGGKWGARNIDDKFKELMFEIFACNMEEDDPAYFATIMESFDQRKVEYAFPDTLQISVRGYRATNLDSVNRRYKNSPIAFTNYKLVIPAPVIISWYHEPITQIVECMKNVSRNCGPMDYILLVGGFSKSSLLLQSVVREFENPKTKVIRPYDPGMAVAAGAVSFGLHPNIVASRCSAYTYGIKVTEEFVTGVHDPQKKVEVNGKFYCRDIFLAFVQINQKVRLNHKRKIHVGKSKADSTSIKVNIYTSSLRGEAYITPEMQIVGHLVIAVPLEEPVGSENIKVTMIFGGTEITASAKHKHTKVTTDCTINFATKMDYSVTRV